MSEEMSNTCGDKRVPRGTPCGGLNPYLTLTRAIKITPLPDLHLPRKNHPTVEAQTTVFTLSSEFSV